MKKFLCEWITNVFLIVCVLCGAAGFLGVFGWAASIGMTP